MPDLHPFGGRMSRHFRSVGVPRPALCSCTVPAFHPPTGGHIHALYRLTHCAVDCQCLTFPIDFRPVTIYALLSRLIDHGFTACS